MPRSTYDLDALVAQLSKAQAQPRYEAVDARVELANIGLSFTLYRHDELKREALMTRLHDIQLAIDACDTEARLRLVKGLVELWFDGEANQVRMVLGDVVNLRQDRCGIFSVTADGHQLRLWYGFPGSIEQHHIDSCGRGLLLNVWGHPNVVARYLQAFLEIAPRGKFVADDGTCMYIGY